MAASNPNTALFFGAQNPQSQQSAMAMLRAQLLAQQYQGSAENYQQGAQPPNPNQETNAGIGIPISKASGMARMLSAAMAGQQQSASNAQQLQAAQDQMQLMANALQGSGGDSGASSGGAGGSAASTSLELAGKVVRDNMIDPTGTLAKADTDMYTAGPVKAAQEGSAIGKYTVGGNADVPLTGNQALRLSSGSAPFGMGGNAPPPPAAPAAAANSSPALPPQGVPNGSAVPAVPPVAQGVALPALGMRPAGSGPIASDMLSPAPVPASVPAIGPGAAPPAMAAAGGAPATAPPQIPFSQVVANAQQGMQRTGSTPPPAIGASPVYAGQVAAQAAGQSEDAKNVASYENGLNKKVSEGASQVRIMNAQEDLAQNFRPGAGEEELAKAAAAAQSLGASPALVNSIARGDQNAVGAVQAFSAMASQHAATQALETMAGGGGQTPRISQAMFESFKDNLSNPNNQPNAIKAINALARQQYMADFNEQQSFQKYKGTPGNDPTKFQSQYAAQINPALMNGRSADPAQAIQAPPPAASAPPLAQRVVGRAYQTPRGMMKWSGTGWLPNAQQ